MAVVTGLAWRRRDRVLGLVSVLGWSSIYLLIASQGSHPLQGYWCYPVAFFALGTGWCVQRCFSACRQRAGTAVAAALAGCLLTLVFLPGSGLRTTWACVRNWNKLEYNPHQFTRSILADLPADARLTVGAEYALDAYGLNRRVLLGIRYYNYFDATRYDYDYAIMGRAGMKEGLDRAMNARIVRHVRQRGRPVRLLCRAPRAGNAPTETCKARPLSGE